MTKYTKEQIEDIAKQYFEKKYPLLDLENDDEKAEISWWDMIDFSEYILNHCTQKNTS